MSEQLIEHLDETGQPCTRHPVTSQTLLAWAAVGSRIAGFHHDSASKLQSLMMAVDEALELLEGQPEVRRALDQASTSVRELHQLLGENRALAKPPQRKRTGLGELLERAAARNSVALAGEIGTWSVHVAPPSTVHALALLIDQLAGAKSSARAIGVSVTPGDEHVSIALTEGAPRTPGATESEAIAIASFLLAREDGALRCTPRGFLVQLPTSARSDAVNP